MRRKGSSVRRGLSGYVPTVKDVLDRIFSLDNGSEMSITFVMPAPDRVRGDGSGIQQKKPAAGGHCLTGPRIKPGVTAGRPANTVQHISDQLSRENV